MSHAPAPRVRFDQRLRDACGGGGPTVDGQDGLVRWPYLQKVEPTSASIVFSSDAEREFSVAWWRPGEQPGERTPAGRQDLEFLSDVQFEARLEGLPQGSIVCYQVFAGDKAWTQPTGFVTAPAPDDTGDVRFVAFGDVGTRTSDQFAVLEQLGTVEYDFAIVTGDIAYDDGKPRELTDNFFGVYRGTMDRVPFFVASGNHEYNTHDAGPFREAFVLPENGGPEGIERWYSFDWGSVHFAMLDTELLDEEQVRWLDADLAAADRPFSVVVAHRPPYSSGSHGSDHGVRDTFGPTIAKHNVDLVLLGHEHHYERTFPIDGVTYVISGGGGRGTRSVGKSSWTALAQRVAHFVYLTANDETLTMVAIDGTGQDFDSVQLRAR